MASSTARIEGLLNEKILLFQDLVEILKEEKKSIVDIDVDKLWIFSEKKQAVASKIEDIRKRILQILDESSIDHHMRPSTFSAGKVIEWIQSDDKDRLNQINVTLILLKKKVHTLAGENKKFISEYLGVMDELIGTISNIGDKTGVYDNSRFPKRQKKTSYMLNTEV